MTGSLEQQISSPAKPNHSSLADSVGEVLSDAAQGLGSTVQNAEVSASTLAASVHLPSLQLFDSGHDSTKVAAETVQQGQANHPSLLTEAGNVAKELGKGALNEIEHHPLQLVETAAIGLAAGAAVTAAVGAAIGAGIIAAPVAAIGGAIVGVATVGYGAYEAYEHSDAITHDIEAVGNPTAYSATDVAQARLGVQNFGGAALETGVGIAAGIAGGIAATAIRTAVTGAAVTVGEGAVSQEGLAADGSRPVDLAPASQTEAPLSPGSPEAPLSRGAQEAPLGPGVPESIKTNPDLPNAVTGATEANTVNASMADGRAATVTLQASADGGTQVTQVQMPDGTLLTRQGQTSHWAAGGDGPEHTVWEGDVRLNDQGELRFVYKYEKTPSLVSVEARLPDGTKVALANADGSLGLPGGTVDALSQHLTDAAAQSVNPLKLDITPDRLQLDGVSTGATVNTKYVLDLNEAEAASVRQLAATDIGIKIVPADEPLGPASGASPAAGAAGVTGSSPSAAVETAGVTGSGPSAAAEAAGENVPGAYEYATPMPDHTASVALFSPGEDGRWNVLTGLREREPSAGLSALPGGFLDMSNGNVEAPADAAARELAEETGIKTSNPELVRIGDAIGRDTRNRIIDFQYAAVASKEDMASLFAGDDLKDLQVQDVQKLLDDPSSLAFDHHDMLSAAYKYLLSTQPSSSAIAH